MSETNAPDPHDTPPEEPPAELAGAEPEAEIDAEIAQVDSMEESTQDETPLPADEMEEEQPELIDVELAQVISTPAGMKGALEASLFTSPDALTLRRLCNVLDTRDKNLVEASLRQLQIELDAQRRGIRLLEGAEGWRLVTRELFGELILRLRGRKRRPPMSPAALETLAIIAYRPGIIRAEIERRKWRHFLLTGDTEDRGALVRNFQQSEGSAVFLISLRAGGFGLNLTAASYVVLYDPWWNPAVENQAIDRTHRIGQTQSVVALRLITKGTIEERITELQERKKALMQTLVGDEAFAQTLSREDFAFLLDEKAPNAAK